MKSSTQIRFDFQNAKQQANCLDELANSLEQQVIRPMSDTAQQLHSAWTGESANRFTAKQGELQDKIRRTSNSLRNLADEIRTIARRVYDAEMQAYYIAVQRRSYGGGGGGGGGGGR